MRIGIFGGTFDPFHNGHAMIVRYVLEEDIADKLIVIPASAPRLREEEPTASPEDRVEMTRLALDGCGRVDVSRVELNRSGVTYTADTLIDVISLYGEEHEYILIVGMDAFLGMNEWGSLRKILSMSSVAVIGRPLWRRSQEAVRVAPGASYFEGPNSFVSGQDVRGRIKRGEPVDDMVHPAVLRFIHDRRLYGFRRLYDTNGEVK